jgi:hypothetical protein
MSQFILNLPSIVEISAGISVISGAYLKIRKIIKHRKEQKDLERAAILQEAKEIAQKYKHELEAKIELLQKDLEHVKESYTSEVKFIGSRIEELRDEVRTQLSQIVILVSKLIDKT